MSEERVIESVEDLTVEERENMLNYCKTFKEKFDKMSDLYSSYQKLLNNKDFKKVILTEYLEKETLRLVENRDMFKLKATPSTNEYAKTQDELINKAIDGITYFKKFLRDLKMRYDIAKKDYEDSLQVADEINHIERNTDVTEITKEEI